MSDRKIVLNDCSLCSMLDHKGGFGLITYVPVCRKVGVDLPFTVHAGSGNRAQAVRVQGIPVWCPLPLNTELEKELNMRTTQHKTNNRVLSPPPGWDQSAVRCRPVAVTDVIVGGMPAVMTFWRPDPSELAMLSAGGLVTLCVPGDTMPPAAISVEAVEAVEATSRTQDVFDLWLARAGIAVPQHDPGSVMADAFVFARTAFEAARLLAIAECLSVTQNAITTTNAQAPTNIAYNAAIVNVLNRIKGLL
jgi:hypothetical protein